MISRRRLLEFAARHPQAARPLDAWYRIAKSRRWNSIEEVRTDFPHADAVKHWTVFNIGGNDFRLVVDIRYGRQALYVRSVLTHAEYDKIKWS